MYTAQGVFLSCPTAG